MSLDVFYATIFMVYTSLELVLNCQMKWTRNTFFASLFSSDMDIGSSLKILVIDEENTYSPSL